MAEVVLENLYKRFSAPNAKSPPDAPSDAVLRNINLTVSDGEFMVLVGPSGCGKSTLLRLIAGLETPTAGKIWIGDTLANDRPPKARDVAMVFQNYALYPHLTVYDNLAFGLRRTGNRDDLRDRLLVSMTRKLPKSLRYRSEGERSAAGRVRQVAQILQIESLLDRLPKQLSGGQKQRVALGRAMARNPQVFLMDEPLSNLDARLRTETRSQIVELQRQLGTTTIYVTHDQTEAMTMGTRIAVINAGQIQQIAAPLDLYDFPANRFVAAFIGSPPMNFIPVRLSKKGESIHPHFRLVLPENWGDRRSTSGDRAVLLGVRPEHLVPAIPSADNLRVRVHRIEALGHETLLSVKFCHPPEETLQVRIPAHSGVKLGEEIGLAIAVEKIHLFDPDTGSAL